MSLDQQGFALAEHHTTIKDFYDQDEVRHIYYPEAEQFLKDLTGAQKVIVFDHNLRNAEIFSDKHLIVVIKFLDSLTLSCS